MRAYATQEYVVPRSIPITVPYSSFSADFSSARTRLPAGKKQMMAMRTKAKSVTFEKRDDGDWRRCEGRVIDLLFAILTYYFVDGENEG